MLYYKNLSKLFFEDYPKEADELLFLTGYVGPGPVKQLLDLGIKTTLIYGMEKNNPQPKLHEQLLKFSEQDHFNILYPESECHSKCYIWLKQGHPIKGLIGSANFSTNGLTTDYRETLQELELKDLFFLKSYIDLIKSQSTNCYEVSRSKTISAKSLDTCYLELYSPKTGKVELASGLNWGHGKGNVNISDAYIAIRKEHIRNFPNLFPPKKALIEERKNANEYIEIVWDDGEVMQALLEGSQNEEGIVYPKQLSSAPTKADLGKYLRRRLNVPEEQLVTTDDLVKYGRNNIEVKRMSEGVYYFDFSI